MDSIIVTEEECKKAAAQFGDLYKLSFSSSTYPAGCMSNSEVNRVFFNTITDPSLISMPTGYTIQNAGGLPSAVTRGICLSKGTQF